MELKVKQMTVKEVIDQSPLTLPIGYRDENGKLHREFTIKDMTGAVDEAMSDPKIRDNAGKVLTEAVFGVLETLGDMKVRKEVARKMYGADREFVLLASYHNSVATDEFLKWKDHCPACRKAFDAQVNYLNLPVFILEQDNHLMELELPRGIVKDGKVFKKMKVTFPNGETQERVSVAVKQNPGSAGTVILSMCTEEIEGLDNWNYDTFKDMVKKDRNAVGLFLNDMRVGVDMRVNMDCPNCRHEFPSGVPASALLGE